MHEAVISIDRLSHSYGNRLALDLLQLKINRGEIFGFLGPNGSGKTTLFRILSTLIPVAPHAITILNFDASTQLKDIRQRIGVVFQSPSLDKQLTARENLRHHGHLYGLSGKSLEVRINTQLEKVGLLERADERVDTFSGGMRRRVELAKGLLNEPQILLLDEPSTGLDPAARIDLWLALEHIRDAGVTILLTTHLMDEADRCTRLAILQEGRLLACDSPLELKKKIGGDVITIVSADPLPHGEALFQVLGIEIKRIGNQLRLKVVNGHESIAQIAQIAPQLIISITLSRPTLEDVFIQMTGKNFNQRASE